MSLMDKLSNARIKYPLRSNRKKLNNRSFRFVITIPILLAVTPYILHY